MRRRDFLDCIAAPLMPGLRPSRPQWVFRTYSGRIDKADSLRQMWKLLCPNAHLWFEALAAESMPQAAVLARFPSFEASRKVTPAVVELFEGPLGSLAGCHILEFREPASHFRERTLQNSRCVLTGFDSLAERWQTRDDEPGRIAVFKAEPG